METEYQEIENNFKCELCHDTGVIDFFESIIEDDVMAPVGERVCECQLSIEEDTYE